MGKYFDLKITAEDICEMGEEEIQKLIEEYAGYLGDREGVVVIVEEIIEKQKLIKCLRGQ